MSLNRVDPRFVVPHRARHAVVVPGLQEWKAGLASAGVDVDEHEAHLLVRATTDRLRSIFGFELVVALWREDDSLQNVRTATALEQEVLRGAAAVKNSQSRSNRRPFTSRGPTKRRRGLRPVAPRPANP